MNLLVDIGNTALKWAALNQGALGPGSRVPADDGLDAALNDAWGGLPRPHRVLVAEVGAGTAGATVARWAHDRWGCESVQVTAKGAAFGVTNSYREPARLGVDRWLGLLAARALDPQAAMIVDCGSAVTVDVLDGEGCHLGGLIVPGLGLARRCLERYTQVRVDDGAAPEVSLLARDTAGAVRGGGLYAVVAFVDRVAQDITHALGGPLRRIITGGDATVLLPLLRDGYEHRPDLVLEGLAVVARADSCAS